MLADPSKRVGTEGSRKQSGWMVDVEQQARIQNDETTTGKTGNRGTD